MHLLSELSPRLQKAVELKSFERLEELYSLLPPTRCAMCGKCCYQGPEIYYVEFLHSLHKLLASAPDRFPQIVERAVKFHLLRLADVSQACPFLEDKACSIHPFRWFVCRWWGLEEEEEFLRHCKRERRDISRKELIKFFKDTYQIELPPEAADRELLYCRNVELTAGERPSQSRKNALLGKIIMMDQEIVPLGTLLRKLNHLDFSTHLCSLYLSLEDLSHYRMLALKEFTAEGHSVTAERLAKKLAQISLPLET